MWQTRASLERLKSWLVSRLTPGPCVKNIPLPGGDDAKPWGPKFESRQINPDFNVLCHLSNIGSGYTLCGGISLPHPSASRHPTMGELGADTMG